MKVPLVLDARELDGADVAIVGAPIDEYVSYRPGTRFGPREVRSAFDGGGLPAVYNLDAAIDPFEVLRVVDHGDAEVVPADGARSLAAIEAAVGRVVDAGAIPFVIGGDHSIAYPDIMAVCARVPRGDVAVVQFDAHADTATSIWGVRRSHGTPFRHLVDEEHLPGERLVQVGLRGWWPFVEEFDWARDAGVRWHRMETLVERGWRSVVDEVLVEIADAPRLFLSVDIDVLDPAFAPGTGTPEPGGMTTADLLRSVRHLAASKDLAGLEIVEVSPPYDPSGITAMAAHRVLLEALTGVALRSAGSAARGVDP